MTTFLLLGPVQASALSEKQLLELCSTSEGTRGHLCLAYILGAADAYIAFGGRRVTPACFPENVSGEMIVDGVVASLKAYEASDEVNAGLAVWSALPSAFPCPKK